MPYYFVPITAWALTFSFPIWGKWEVDKELKAERVFQLGFLQLLFPVGDFALPGRGPGDRGVRQRTEVCLPGRGIGRVLNRTRLIPCQATLRSALLHLLFPGGSTFVMQRMHSPPSLHNVPVPLPCCLASHLLQSRFTDNDGGATQT